MGRGDYRGGHRFKKTGIKGFHVHQTRHTFACRYVEAGGELAMLQEILGHASVVTTQRYGRPNAKAIRNDANRVHMQWESAYREQNREQHGKVSSLEPHFVAATR